VNPYRYQRVEPKFNLKLLRANSKWSQYAVEFSSAHPLGYETSDVAYGEYFQPVGVEQAPLAILVHGWGERGAVPCQLMAPSLVKNGIACFILYLVFHSSRMPEAMKQRAPNLTPEEWYEGYRASVIEIRQIVDWAATRPEIDQSRVGVVGVSMGGFISAITMGVDERLGAGVFIISGGNSARMTWESRRSVVERRCLCSEEECYQLRREVYPQYVAKVIRQGLDNVSPPMRCFLTDPLTYAPLLRQRPILMINALWDEAIPKGATLDFWEACGQPPIVWLPGTHISVWLWYPLILRRTLGFLNSTLATQKSALKPAGV